MDKKEKKKLKKAKKKKDKKEKKKKRKRDRDFSSSSDSEDSCRKQRRTSQWDGFMHPSMHMMMPPMMPGVPTGQGLEPRNWAWTQRSDAMPPTPGQAYTNFPAHRAVNTGPKPPPSAAKKQRELYVGNLQSGLCNEQALRELFTPACQLLPEWQESLGQPVASVDVRGGGTFAFVEFQNEQIATKALQIFDKMEVGGRQINVGRPSGYHQAIGIRVHNDQPIPQPPPGPPPPPPAHSQYQKSESVEPFREGAEPAQPIPPLPTPQQYQSRGLTVGAAGLQMGGVHLTAGGGGLTSGSMGVSPPPTPQTNNSEMNAGAAAAMRLMSN